MATIDESLIDCLPPLIRDNQVLGMVQQSAAQALGIPVSIPVAVGGGDNMMAAIGTGNVDSGVVTISLGSSGTVYSHSQQPIADSAGRLAAFCSSTGGWLPLLCTMNCTLSTELFRQLLNKDLQEFEAALTQSPLGAEGVLTLPFFNGERTPNLPNSRASLLGLTSDNMMPENLLRSATEAATYGLRLGIEALRDKGVAVEEIRLTGGGSRSAAWRQIVADVCQAPVTVMAPDEGAAFGAALQALAVTHLESDLTLVDIVEQHLVENPSSRCSPNPEAVKQYNQIYDQYLRAIDLVTPFYH